MSEYQYRIITEKGKEKRGNIEAKTVEAAKAQLKAEKNIVLSIGEAGAMSKDINFNIGGQKVTPRDFGIFCRQFDSILKAGVSIISALDMMKEQTENKALKAAISEVHEDVSKGEPLATAMRKQGKIFPGMLCNMVEAGEASGNLEMAFSRMAVQFDKESKLKAQFKKAMTYPLILCIVMFGVIIVMMTYVIPNFMKIFDDMGTTLPAVTMVVVNISHFFQKFWWLMILIIVGIVVGIKLYDKTPNGKLVLGKIAIDLPIFGKIQRKTACAQLSRTLSTLLGAGVPLVDALEITAKSMSNAVYKQAVMEAREQVMRGVPLSKALKSSNYFPTMIIQMIAIGENTGNIEEMLENVAGYFEEDVEMATQQMTSLMEPIMIVVMALIVGFLVISIIMPMVTMYDTLSTAA